MNLLISARPHSFELDLTRAAIIVIDAQNDFCHADGYCQHELGLDGAPVRQIFEPIRQLTNWARTRNVPVIWTVEAHQSDLSDLPACKARRYANAGYPVGSAGKMGRFLVRGEWGAQVLDELAPREAELVLPKPAQSIWTNTDLEANLIERGITQLLMCGVTTQCCVLASYRAANDLGFWSLLVEDCCAAFDEREHRAAIEVIVSEGGAVGWVCQSADVMGMDESI